ncbi:MAG: hypothetical protein FWC14_05440 [Candidatus Bathyarchaeota archaeon]|uniref:hypothetical protein n=1 Tax=Candidatus Bathycorpusculum sp. TaxID=2994959 RepID=UPI0028187806|nr:hypothetical protein [Candidatus Termiticorpusculum sp.]MCL2291753.1 hypothetical protein [Candidatus Termiticorpusculum sp.]
MQSADAGTRWTVGLLKSIPDVLNNSQSELTKQYSEYSLRTRPKVSTDTLNVLGEDLEYFLSRYPQRELEMFNGNLDNFAVELKTLIVKELEGNSILSRIRKPNKTVNLKKVVNEALRKEGLPVWATDFIRFDSKVTATHFEGNSMLNRYKSARSDFGQQNKASNTKTQKFQKLL